MTSNQVGFRARTQSLNLLTLQATTRKQREILSRVRLIHHSFLPTSMATGAEHTDVCCWCYCLSGRVNKWRFNPRHLDFVRAPTAALTHQSKETLWANVSPVIIGCSPLFFSFSITQWQCVCSAGKAVMQPAVNHSVWRGNVCNMKSIWMFQNLQVSIKKKENLLINCHRKLSPSFSSSRGRMWGLARATVLCMCLPPLLLSSPLLVLLQG